MTTYPPLVPGCYYHLYNRANGKENLFREDENYRHFLKLYTKYILPVADTFSYGLMRNHFHALVRIKEKMVYKYSKDDFRDWGPGNTDCIAKANADGYQGQTPTDREEQTPTDREGQTPTDPRDADAVGFAGFDDIKWETVTDPSASPGPDGIGNNETGKRKQADATRHFSHFFNAYAKYINKKYRRTGSLFQRPFRRKAVETEDYLRRLVLYIHNNPVHHGFVKDLEEYPWSSYPSCLSSNPTFIRRDEVLEWFGGIQRFRESHLEFSKDKAKAMEEWLVKAGALDGLISPKPNLYRH